MLNSRRDFLKKTALLTGAAGLSGMLPASIQKALAINPAPGSTWQDAEHVVILMQENRSFDHCFGSLKGVRGFNDPRAIDLPNGNPVWLQSNNKGETFAPFRLDIHNTKATWMNSLPHSWDNQVNARNDGKFDQWLNEKRSGNKDYKDMPLTLGYHNRQDLPFNYAMADAFTVCDQHFCSSLTGTSPNRNYLWSGTIRKEQNEHSQANVWNGDGDFGTFEWATFPERLEDNGISWKCYQNELSIPVGFEGEEDAWLSNFTDNNLEFFKQFNVRLHPEHIAYRKKRMAELPGQITSLEAKINALPPGDASIARQKKQLKQWQAELEDIKANPALFEPGAFDKLTDREKNLHLKAFSTNRGDPNYHQLTTLKYNDNGVERELNVPKGDPLFEFRRDVEGGKLPAVSWLTASENFSDHPGAPWYGAWYVSEVLDILTKNPEVWKKTIFILTYDENDGYFDHIPPYVVPHPHQPGSGKVSAGIDTDVEFVTREQELARGPSNDYTRESPIGLGYRVPMIVASPWSRGGYVNSEVFDHTSTLQFLETFLSHKTGKSVKETNISEWRRTICGNLTSVFRPYNGEKLSYPASLQKAEFVEGIHKAQFKELPETGKALSDSDIAAIKKAPHASSHMPQQEPGIKPSCALSYELYADSHLNRDKSAIKINLKAGDKLFGRKSLGSPFIVYPVGQVTGGHIRNYAARAGDCLNDTWDLKDFKNGQYHLRVYAPNGFYREFKGDAQDPRHLMIEVDYYSGDKNAPAITFTFDSPGKLYKVQIIDNAYKTAKVEHVVNGATKAVGIVKSLEKSFGWYDFTIKVTGYNNFEKRYAGRVETGKHSFTDPLMGRAI